MTLTSDPVEYEFFEFCYHTHCILAQRGLNWAEKILFERQYILKSKTVDITSKAKPTDVHTNHELEERISILFNSRELEFSFA